MPHYFDGTQINALYIEMPHYFDGTQMSVLCIENATLPWWDTNECLVHR